MDRVEIGKLLQLFLENSGIPTSNPLKLEPLEQLLLSRIKQDDHIKFNHTSEWGGKPCEKWCYNSAARYN